MNQNNKCNEKPLANAVRAAIRQKGMTVQEAADAIKVSHVHMTSLLNGARSLTGLASDKLDLLSQLTGIRKGEMFVLGGLLSAEEFYPAQATQPDLINQRLSQLQNDPELRKCCIDTTEIQNASDNLKLLLSVLYEKAITGSMNINAALTKGHELAI